VHSPDNDYQEDKVKVMERKTEEMEFTPVQGDHVLDLDASEYPELAEDEPKDDVMLMVKGTVTDRDGDQLKVKLNEVGVIHGKKPGSGERFKKLEGDLEERGAKNPGALAAYIGRKKYGKGRFQKLASRGRKRLFT